MAGDNLKLTPALEDAVIDALRRGTPVSTAFRAAGIREDAFSKYLRAAESGVWPDGGNVNPATLTRLQAFADRVAQTKAELEIKLLSGVIEASETVGKSGVREWRAGAWMLNNHPWWRETYRQDKQTTNTIVGEVRHEHVVARQLSVEEVRGALRALEAPAANAGES